MSIRHFSKQKDHPSFVLGAPEKKRKMGIFHKRRTPKPVFPTKIVAQDVAKNITGSENVTVKRRHIPQSMISYIEKNTHCTFKKKPTFYTYAPKKGHRLRPKRQVGGWDGASITCFDKQSGKINGTVVVIPESHLKDKRVKDNVLLHELVETNVGQQFIGSGVPRSQAEVNSFEHSVFAMAYEKKDLEKKNMKREDVSRLAKKLFNEHMTKKREK